jgi:hypothetical protein
VLGGMCLRCGIEVNRDRRIGGGGELRVEVLEFFVLVLELFELILSDTC